MLATYPISEEEKGKRHKNWAEALAGYTVAAFNAGKEAGGKKYVDKVTEEFHKMGQERGAGHDDTYQIQSDDERGRD